MDHCWVQEALGLKRPALSLLATPALAIKTDHLYTMGISLSPLNQRIDRQANPKPRYRIARVQDQRVTERLSQEFSTILAGPTGWRGINDINNLDRILINAYQEVCERVLGRIYPDRRVRVKGSPLGLKTEENVPIEIASSRCYRQAARASQENGVIHPTEAAAQEGISALVENHRLLRQRFQDPPTRQWNHQWTTTLKIDGEDSGSITLEEVQTEIRNQKPSKGCGADGVHIRVLRGIIQTDWIHGLHRLYRRCWETGATPTRWNTSQIYLLTKDTTKPRNAENLRPITIISVIRKVFEKLLLVRFDQTGWAQLHSAQVGFQSRSSVYICVATVHHWLASGERDTAVMLDFRAAFDTIDHRRLDRVLANRGCPDRLRSLIRSLMFQGVESSIFINHEESSTFSRERGVLQGSPLSPALFNLFIDRLVVQLNKDSRTLRALFYADDGIIVPLPGDDIKGLLETVDRWANTNGLELNVDKCGYLTRLVNRPTLRLGTREIPFVKTYRYLGFPLTAQGVDFIGHLETRLQAAIRRTRFLSIFSDTWTIAQRLWILRYLLAPMFEYRAPLVWSWYRGESVENQQAFDKTVLQTRELTAWVVAGKATKRPKTTANLCGLLPLQDRLQHLRTAFQRVIQAYPESTPLKRLLIGPDKIQPSTAFLRELTYDRDYQRFERTRKGRLGLLKEELHQFLQKQRGGAIQKIAQNAKLTALIPQESRQKSGLIGADSSLTGRSLAIQRRLFQYRQGVFGFGRSCVCSPEKLFRRGHEVCPALSRPGRLSRREKQQKAQTRLLFQKTPIRLTAIDWLLNTGKVDRASQWLSSIEKQLDQIYHQRQQEKDL